jgi:hypothetical protein
MHYKRWSANGDPNVTKNTPPGEPRKFIENVVKPFNGNECLTWPFARSDSGYARIGKDGKTKQVCRMICEEIHGPPPTPEHEAAHSCGKGHEGCVNPNHLSWKTHTENMDDQLLHGTRIFGRKNGRVRLTEEQIPVIREMISLNMSERKIAKIFGVHRFTIRGIKVGDTWSWVP